jgi:hypothetical protein
MASIFRFSVFSSTVKKLAKKSSASLASSASDASAQKTVEASPIWILWPLSRSRKRLSADV